MKQLMKIGLVAASLIVGGCIAQNPASVRADANASSQVNADKPDTDEVSFGDPALQKIVADSMGIRSGTITYGDIRHFKGQPYISAIPQAVENLTSLKGLESLNELPNGIYYLGLNIQAGVSLAPIAGLTVSQLSIQQDGMHTNDFEVLNTLKFHDMPAGTAFNQVEIVGNTGNANRAGLVNDDLNKLAPLFNRAYEANKTVKDFGFNLSNQRITDFSFFNSGPIKNTDVFATDEYQVFSDKIQIDPEGFTENTEVKVPTQVKGMDGEPVQTSTRIWNARTSQWDAIKKQGTTTLATGLVSTDKWIIVANQLAHGYPETIKYANGNSLRVAGTQYYPISWEKTPTPQPEPEPTPTPTPKPDPDLPPKPEPGLKKGTVVYALKKVYLYQHPTFKKGERTVGYVRKQRVNRPMFVVTGYARSKAGLLRYQVRDVNHQYRHTDGRTGYITAKSSYVRPVYYQTKHQTVTVINPQGVNLYKNKNLTQRTRHLRQGQLLKVKRIVKHRLTTRYQLSNGNYVTANRKLVKLGTVTYPKYVMAKGALNRYQTVNLDKKNRHYQRKQRAIFKVSYTDYSRNTSNRLTGVKRYKVAGGYISGNPRLVTNLYYQGRPHSRQVRVIARSGIRGYQHQNLTGRSYKISKGKVLKIRRIIVRNGLVNRYQLTNGHYITANKTFVKTK